MASAGETSAKVPNQKIEGLVRSKNKVRRKKKKKHSIAPDSGSISAFKIAYWNSRGLTNKLGLLTRALINNNINTINILDTKTYNEDCSSSPYTWTAMHENRPELSARGPSRGTGVLSKTKVSLLHSDAHNSWYRMNSEIGQILVLAAYWPNSCQRTLQREAMNKCLEYIDDNIHQYDNVLLTGDFNVRLNANGDAKSTHLGTVFHTELNKRGLLHTHLDLHKMQGSYTRVETYSGALQCSSPDHSWMSLNLAKCLKMGIILEETLGSDHKIVLLEFNFQTPKQQKFLKNSYKLTKENYDNLERAVNDHTWTNEELNSVKNFTATFKKYCDEHLSFKRAIPCLPKRRAPVPWIKLKHELLQCRLKLRHHPNKLLAKKYKQIRSKVCKYGNMLKLNKQEEARDELHRTQRLNPITFWDLFNKLREERPGPLPSSLLNVNGPDFDTPEEVVNAWCDHFSSIASKVNNQKFDESFKIFIERRYQEIKDNLPSNDDLDSDFTELETLMAIKKMRKRKAPGADGVLVEFLHATCDYDINNWDKNPNYHPSPFLCSVTKLGNNVYNSSLWPHLWNMGIIKPLYKKGERKDCANYRGITFLSVIAKTFMSVIAKRLSSHLEVNDLLSESQSGFRPNRGCRDQIFTLHSTLDWRKKNGHPTFVCFLDLVKAYDVVWRKGLLVKLMDYGITGKMWRLLDSSLALMRRCMHKDVAHGNEVITKSNFFEITDYGLPQGAPESCSLFNVFINELPEMLNKKHIGINLPNGRMCSLLIADDVAILTKSVLEMKIALHITTDFFRRWRAALNPSPKSAIMVIGPKLLKESLKDNLFECAGVKLDLTDTYKYLGMWMSDDLSWKTHIRHIFNKVSKTSGTLAWLCNKHGGLRPRTCIFLFNTIVRPAMEYGAETWSVNLPKKFETMLEKVLLSFARKVTSVPKCVPSAFVRMELGLQSMRSRWDKLILNYVDAICKVEDERYTKITLANILASNAVTNWEAGLIKICRSFENADCPDRFFGIEELHNLTKDLLPQIGSRDEEAIWSEIDSLNSLKFYKHIRSREKIDQKHAWAKTHIGRHSHRFLENYLDDWRYNKEPSKLYLLARANALPLNSQTRRFNNLDLHFGTCQFCKSEDQQDLHHLVCLCPGLSNLQQKLHKSTMWILSNSRTENVLSPNTFSNLLPQEQLYVYLGKRINCTWAEDKIRIAFQKFLHKIITLHKNSSKC